jgi:hypothetical protein
MPADTTKGSPNIIQLSNGRPGAELSIKVANGISKLYVHASHVPRLTNLLQYKRFEQALRVDRPPFTYHPLPAAPCLPLNDSVSLANDSASDATARQRRH